MIKASLKSLVTLMEQNPSWPITGLMLMKWTTRLKPEIFTAIFLVLLDLERFTVARGKTSVMSEETMTFLGLDQARES